MPRPPDPAGTRVLNNHNPLVLVAGPTNRTRPRRHWLARMRLVADLSPSPITFGVTHFG